MGLSPGSTIVTRNLSGGKYRVGIPDTEEIFSRKPCGKRFPNVLRTSDKSGGYRCGRCSVRPRDAPLQGEFASRPSALFSPLRLRASRPTGSLPMLDPAWSRGRVRRWASPKVRPPGERLLERVVPGLLHDPPGALRHRVQGCLDRHLAGHGLRERGAEVGVDLPPHRDDRPPVRIGSWRCPGRSGTFRFGAGLGPVARPRAVQGVVATLLRLWGQAPGLPTCTTMMRAAWCAGRVFQRTAVRPGQGRQVRIIEMGRNGDRPSPWNPPGSSARQVP